MLAELGIPLHDPALDHEPGSESGQPQAAGADAAGAVSGVAAPSTLPSAGSMEGLSKERIVEVVLDNCAVRVTNLPATFGADEV